MRPLDVAQVRQVVIRLPNWMGDTVMALPALKAVRQAFPDRLITLVGPWAHLLAHQSLGDRLLDSPRTLRDQLDMVRRFRTDRAMLAILFPNSFRAAVMACVWGCRWRVGYQTDGRGALLTHAVTPARGMTHQVDAYLGLVRAVGIPTGEPTPRVHVTHDQLARAGELLRSVGIDGGARIVGIQLGSASGPARQWAPARFAELAETLRREESVDVVLLGSRREEPLAEWILAHVNAPVGSLVGKDTPDLVAAIRARCSVMVSADTGPAHLAAAVGKPVVTLFGPTDPRNTRPKGQHQTVLTAGVPCSPCFFSHCPIDHICMTGITVDQVRAAVVAALSHDSPVTTADLVAPALSSPTRAENRRPGAPRS